MSVTPTRIKFSNKHHGFSYALDEAGVRTCFAQYPTQKMLAHKMWMEMLSNYSGIQVTSHEIKGNVPLR